MHFILKLIVYQNEFQFQVVNVRRSVSLVPSFFYIRTTATLKWVLTLESKINNIILVKVINVIENHEFVEITTLDLLTLLSACFRRAKSFTNYVLIACKCLILFLCGCSDFLLGKSTNTAPTC